MRGDVLTTVDKELQKRCSACNADYETELDLLNFVEFVVREASRQTAIVDVDVLGARVSTDVYWLKQSCDKSLFDYREGAEHVTDKSNTAVQTHSDDELLSPAKVTDGRAAKLFISGLRSDIYGDPVDDPKTCVATKTTPHPVGADKACDTVTEWAQARGVSVSKKGGKVQQQSVLDDSNEINVATTFRIATAQPGRGKSGKEGAVLHLQLR